VAYAQGAIVVADDPFGNTPKRPYLIVSNTEHPFHGEEYITAGITTTARSAALELTAERFGHGRLPRTSYVSPWAIVTLKGWMITKQPAEATGATVGDVHRKLQRYLRT
jgi:mRNA-degrading endonuclease toxin of MazEF toxin-antitoxin module